MLYKNENTTYETEINSILENNATSNLIGDLVELSLFNDAKKCEDLLLIVDIYKLLGIEKFTELVDLLDGHEISLPSRESFKETITAALCYYYRRYKSLEWSEIKEKLNDEKLKTLKYSCKVKKLQEFMEYIADKSQQRG